MSRLACIINDLAFFFMFFCFKLPILSNKKLMYFLFSFSATAVFHNYLHLHDANNSAILYLQIIDTIDHLLEQKRDPELAGLRNAFLSKDTTAAILILCDILQPVNIFCKYLQGSVDFSVVTIRLKVIKL